MLRLRDVSLVRDGHRLLSNLDLAVEPGERLILLGPNGAGKTLLMQLGHRLIEPTEGEVVPAAAGVREAMVFQRPVLLRRSVLGNVLYAVDHALPDHRPAGWHEDRLARADAALQLVGLKALSGRFARVLSGGEQQRLALARAAALRPDLLWLDEPTANLDPSSTRAIEEVVLRMSSEGVTCVMSTHDIGQARRLAQRVLLMAGGRIIEATAASRFFTEPATESGRRYLRGELLAD